MAFILTPHAGDGGGLMVVERMFSNSELSLAISLIERT